MAAPHVKLSLSRLPHRCFAAEVAACPESTRLAVRYIRHDSVCGHSGVVLSVVCCNSSDCCRMPPTVPATVRHKLLLACTVVARLQVDIHMLVVVEDVSWVRELFGTFVLAVNAVVYFQRSDAGESSMLAWETCITTLITNRVRNTDGKIRKRVAA